MKYLFTSVHASSSAVPSNLAVGAEPSVSTDSARALGGVRKSEGDRMASGDPNRTAAMVAVATRFRPTSIEDSNQLLLLISSFFDM